MIDRQGRPNLKRDFTRSRQIHVYRFPVQVPRRPMVEHCGSAWQGMSIFSVKSHLSPSFSGNYADARNRNLFVIHDVLMVTGTGNKVIFGNLIHRKKRVI